MIAVEILVGIIIATVVLVGIAKIGAPLAEAFANRLQLKFEELGPETEKQLKSRISALEEELRTVKAQVSALQDSTDFVTRMVASQEKTQPLQADRIKIVPEKKQV